MSGVLEAGHAIDGVSVTTLELEERGQAISSVLPGLRPPPVAHGDPHWLWANGSKMNFYKKKS